MVEVYHGSHIEIRTPDIFYGRMNLDFGRGFYVTTLNEQAEKWARRQAVFCGGRPVVSVYSFEISGLNVLKFGGYTEEWLDFVVRNRRRATGQESPEYDAVYGNIADDDVAAAIDGYTRLLEMNRVNADVKKALLYQLTFSKPNNQYCIATERALSQLKFVKSYGLEE